MIYLYPANKMETLVELASKIQTISPLPIFAKEVMVVQNAGMQHWLSMSLANCQGISFNFSYKLPAQFLWNLVHELTPEQVVAEQDPFSREALSWRIFALLGTDEAKEDQVFTEVTQYWLKDGTEDPLKRYQLSCELADLFEQYLVFRPDWINAWHDQQAVSEKMMSESFVAQEPWQRKLWQMLTREQAYNPESLVKRAIEHLADNSEVLPKRISFFGINAMAPMWLEFIEALSEHTQVHFFHLNPCFSYWGDLITEKQAMRSISAWTDNLAQMNESVGNPLLANLGQQGREFLSMVQGHATMNIEAFSTVDDRCDTELSVLGMIQQDILQLIDKRSQPIDKQDDSIVLTSSHSALREVQGLHDWLLHQFNKDKTLTPKDILVMCPHIEEYAPYVNAVFTRGWQNIADDVPPLPCSIADRVLIDADPIIASFAELLTLPDSRFQVSQIISWLRIASIQEKHQLCDEDLNKIVYWLDKVHIHWGRDQAHKAEILGLEQASNTFTWQYGIERLIQGIAYSDEEVIFDDVLLCPNVESSDTLLLGKLLEVLERLQLFSQALTSPRTPTEWHLYLKSMVSSFYDDKYDSVDLIDKALEDLLTYCHDGEFDQPIELAIVREFLTNHFSQPDPGRQFMVGQVTFCSMVPMRSIPFKIIAVLGLNDGEFPRVRQPYSFDLMSQSAGRLGDRSRRGDDRYLFLEAIISARQALYLSYQGKNIKNNKDKQASIVLTELMEYLASGYGWQCFNGKTANIRQLAMQPYSLANYQGKYASFDKNWLRISPQIQNETASEKGTIGFSEILPEQVGDKISLTVEQLVRFFNHPAKHFANKQLSLFLDTSAIELSDEEPFAADHLSKYLLKQVSLNDLVMNKQSGDVSSRLAYWQHYARLTGHFPELPSTEAELDKLLTDSHILFDHIEQQSTNDLIEIEHTIQLKITLDSGATIEVEVSAKGVQRDDQLIVYRSSTPKASDVLSMYLSLLILKDRHDLNGATGFYFNSKAQQNVVAKCQHTDSTTLNNIVKWYLKGQSQPLLINANLAYEKFSKKKFEQSHLDKFWLDANQAAGYVNDPYMQYFFPNPPKLDDIACVFDDIYLDIFNAVVVEKQ
ncbi:exodeoxyribonuclease V subunit gamma [Thalassotalea marina]|nr:exodeoxyribonuclease V subunit gamma [Thalassotalea marina]